MSESSINAVKWAGAPLLAGLTLFAIALVHSGNPTAARVAMGVFATAVAVVIRCSRRKTSPSPDSLALIRTCWKRFCRAGLSPALTAFQALDRAVLVAQKGQFRHVEEEAVLNDAGHGA